MLLLQHILNTYLKHDQLQPKANCEGSFYRINKKKTTETMIVMRIYMTLLCRHFFYFSFKQYNKRRRNLEKHASS